MDLLLDRYGIDAISCTSIGYNMNDVYQIHTNSQDYCLRVHNPCDLVFGSGFFSKGSFEFEMLFLYDLYHYFLTKGIVLQKPISDCSGSFVVELPNNSFATMVTWVEGNSIDLDEATEDDYYRIGELLALLHKFGSKNATNYKISRQ